MLVTARVISALWNSIGPDSGALGSDTIRSLQGIQTAYGGVAMMLFIAVLVPVVEELSFRGVVLRTLSRHVAPWAAVIVQAAVFMVLHEETGSYPYIFLLALLTAWLARRSGGLLAPIMLHATNNAIAGLSVLALDMMFETLR
jgi:membrane protease YdiL (CAAX protease family)